MTTLKEFQQKCIEERNFLTELETRWEELMRLQEHVYGPSYSPKLEFLERSAFFPADYVKKYICPVCGKELEKTTINYMKFIVSCSCGYEYAYGDI